MFFVFFDSCQSNKEEAENLRREAAKMFIEQKLNRAKELYQNSLDYEPNHAPTIFMIGKIEYYSKNLSAAEEQFDNLLSIDKCHPAGKYWYNKVKAINASKKDQSLKELLVLARELPNRWEVVYTVGTMLEEQGKITEAIELYNEAIADEQKLSLIYLRLNRIYEKAEMKSAAERYARKMKMFDSQQQVDQK